MEKNVHNDKTISRPFLGDVILNLTLCGLLNQTQSQPYRQTSNVIKQSGNKKGGDGAVVICVLCVILLSTGWSDFCRRRVPNPWILFGVLAGGWLRGIAFFAPAGIVLVVVFFLFRLRLMGAGDGKLMAVIAGYLGLRDGLYAIGAGIAVGAIWSLCLLWRRKDIMVRLSYLSAWFRQIFLTKTTTAYEGLSGKDKSETVPLAACLALGTVLYLFYSRAAGAGKGLL